MKFEGGRYKTRLNLSGAALPCLGHPYGSTSMPTCERLAPPGLYLRHLWFRTSVPGRTNCLWNAFRAALICTAPVARGLCLIACRLVGPVSWAPSRHDTKYAIANNEGEGD